MRSLTMFVVATVVVMISGTSSAQEASHRLTAEIFVEAGFPVEIVEAVKRADDIAKLAEANQAEARQWVEEIGLVFDKAVFMPQIPLEIFEKLQNSYEAALQKFLNTDLELRQADYVVTYLYFNWLTTQGGSDTKLVFQEWKKASFSGYVNISEEEAAMYRLMISIGRSKIVAAYRERDSWYRPVPHRAWRVKNDE